MAITTFLRIFIRNKHWVIKCEQEPNKDKKSADWSQNIMYTRSQIKYRFS